MIRLQSCTRPTAALALLPLIAACGESREGASDGGWAGSIDTLANGRVVVRNLDIPLWDEGEAWVLEERFRLGALDGDGADVFGEILDLEIGPAGELYVLDSQASEVRVFDQAGGHVRTLGRAGEGPGELNGPAGITIGPDGHLWVMNWRNSRFTAYDVETGEVALEPRRLAFFTRYPWPGRFDADGRLLDIGISREWSEGGDPVLLLLDEQHVPKDTLRMPDADDRDRILFTRDGVPVSSVMVPFAPQPAWAPHPHRGIVVGEGGAYRIHHVGFGGDTTRTVEVTRDPTPVSGAERDSALAAFADLVERFDDARPDRDPDVPSDKPAHGAITVDDTGHLWVRRTVADGEPHAWDVFDPDGRLLGSVAVPIDLGYIEPAIRGRRAALAAQVDGIPTVVVCEIANR